MCCRANFASFFNCDQGMQKKHKKRERTRDCALDTPDIELTQFLNYNERIVTKKYLFFMQWTGFSTHRSQKTVSFVFCAM